jgi:hypothetical protein
MQSVLNIGIATVSGSLLTLSNLNGEELIDARVKSIVNYVKELETEMMKQELSNLKRYTNFHNISIEEFNLLEELIERGIKEKNSFLKKIIQLVTIYFGKDNDKTKTELVSNTLNITKELNEHDCRLLLYFSYEIIKHRISVPIQEEESIFREFNEKKTELHKIIINDPYILSEDIYISSKKLEALGLIKQSCSLYPSDDIYETDERSFNNSNKNDMLNEFNSKNNEGATEKFKRFIITLGEIPFEV